MTHALINTLEYVKILTQVGFSQREAEGLNKAQMMATQAILSQVATSEGLKDLRTEMQSEFKNVRAEMKDEFKNVRTEMQIMAHELRTEMQTMAHELRTEMQTMAHELRAEMQTMEHKLRAEMQTMGHELRAEIKAVEHRLEVKIDALKPFVYRVMITIMLANLTVIGLGMGALAVYLKPY